MTASYLLPIADREPLAWIVHEQRTAFSAHRAKEAAALRTGDRLLLYTTRSCFHNPTRDRGRVIGVASVKTQPKPLSEPVTFGDREFPIGVSLTIESLAPFRQGVELAPLVRRLAAFPDAATWSARMRRALVPLTAADTRLLARELSEVTRPYPRELPEYQLS